MRTWLQFNFSPPRTYCIFLAPLLEVLQKVFWYQNIPVPPAPLFLDYDTWKSFQHFPQNQGTFHFNQVNGGRNRCPSQLPECHCRVARAGCIQCCCLAASTLPES